MMKHKGGRNPNKSAKGSAKGSVGPKECVPWVPRHILEEVHPRKRQDTRGNSKKELFLRDAWYLGYMGYSDVWDVIPVMDFNSAQTYWQMTHWTPYPAELLMTTTQSRAVQAQPIGNIRSLFLFRTLDTTTQKPMAIEMGPHMQVVYRYEVKSMDEKTLNHEWEEISLASIGETINQTSWALQGIRLLDRTKQPHVSHRFEFWCAKDAPDVEQYARERSRIHNGKFTISKSK